MNGTHLTSLFSICLLLALISPPADARIYSWVDENGDTHYGDKVPSKYRQDSTRVKLRGESSTFSSVAIPSTSYGRVSPSSSSGPSSTIRQVSNEPKINLDAKRTRHNPYSKHVPRSRHAKKSRHAEGSRHPVRTRHATQSRHSY